MFIFYFCVQIFFFKLLILNGEPLSPRSVKTKYGVLRGVLRHYTKQSVNPDLSSSILELPNKFSVEIFRSVPFAQPPIANLRFLPPVTQSRWRGTKLANRFLSVCIQNTAEVASSDILPFEIKDMNKNDAFFKKQDIYFSSLRKNTSDLLKLIRNKKHSNESSMSFNNINETEYSSKNQSSDQNLKNKIHIKNNFEREYISNLLKTHSSYLLPFKPYLLNQNEDCLYLNLYVPYNQNNMNKESFPVLVFVHGESFDWGTGNAYDGSFLAGIKNMIVVTLNYRLGVFGFMPSLIEGSVRTNHGILDVLASLHWIQDNIENFGGSTYNITLVGHQRGAALVQFLKKSSLSKGLFQRSIIFSGSALSNWALAEQPEFYTRALASKLECITKKDSLTKEQINFKTSETHDLFRSKLSLNLNLSNHFTESDEQIFKCLRSRTTEQLKTASTRLTNSYFSPFYSLFGPTIDSFLIKSDSNSFSDLFLNTSLRKNLISNSIKNDHNLLLGFSSNRPKLKLGLINFFEKLSKLPESEALYYLNFFMKDFFSFVNNLVKNKYIKNLNYIDKLFLQKSVNKINLINNSSSWIFKKQDELSNIFYSLLLDVLIIAPVFNAANTQFYDSIYTFILSSEQKNNFEDEELSSLFGSSLAGYYFNVTDGLGRFRTNQTNLYQIKQSELMIASVYSFMKTGNPTALLNKKNRQEHFTWPKYNLNSKKFLLLDNQWKVMSSNTKNNFLQKISKLLEVLETNESLNASTLFDLEKQLIDKLQTINNTSFEDKTTFVSSFFSKLIAHLDLKIKNYNQLIKQKSKEDLKFLYIQKTVNSSQVNNVAIESPDPGGGSSNTLISETPINDSNDMKKKFEKSTSFTGNLIRNRENSFSSRIELKNQTNEHKKSLSNSFFSISNFDSGKKTLIYTNAMIAIFSAGLLMLFVNVFVLFLGYKCIQKRKILKRNETSSKEIISKKKLNSLPLNSSDNQILDPDVCLTPNTINFSKNLENISEETQINLNEKCLSDQTQYCNCPDFQEISLIKDENSYYTSHLNNGQNCSPLSHLVARPICNLLTTNNFNSENINSSHEIDQVKVNLQSSSSDNLAQIIALSSMNNKEFNFNSCNEQSKKQDLYNDNNLSNCDYKILNQTPMLAVLENSSNTSLLQGFNAIDCSSELYNVFQSHNFCTPFNKNNSTSKSLMNSCFQEPMSNINVTLLNTNNAITSTPVNIVNEPQIRAHCPQTIQLQLLTKNLDNDFQN